MSTNNFEFVEMERRARERIPAHLDADELIANAWLNAADVNKAEVLNVFNFTVDMYIDQDCSSF